MKPMEAYAVLLRIHTELTHMSQALYPKGKCFSQEELAAILIAFEALRKMEEQDEKSKN